MADSSTGNIPISKGTYSTGSPLSNSNMLGNLGDYLNKLKPQYDDDSIDRLNYVYTIYLLLFFAVTILAKSFVGEPLQCWVPAQFKGPWEKYVENYCFVENTYWLPLDEEFPDPGSKREEREIQYYQWVPFILAFQALMFFAPRMVWKALNLQTGLNITALMQNAFLTTTDEKTKKKELKGGKDVEKNAKIIADHISSRKVFYEKKRENDTTRLSVFKSQYWENYLTFLYVFMKFLFLINVLLQFVVLNHFLGPQYTFWGFGILSDILNGRQWQSSGHFPRVTMCDVSVRELGKNIHNWSVQCVLMVNMFNEKIFIFLWFWFLMVTILTTINLIYWLIISSLPGFSIRFIERYLQLARQLDLKHRSSSSPDRDTRMNLRSEHVKQFVDETLRKDGVTVLRLISDNCGDQITAEIVNQLWQMKHGYTKANETTSTNKIISRGDGEKDPLLDSPSSTSTDKNHSDGRVKSFIDEYPYL